MKHLLALMTLSTSLLMADFCRDNPDLHICGGGTPTEIPASEGLCEAFPTLPQ